MRRYSIQIDGGPTFDSQANGANNPGAQLVEMDIPVIAYDLPIGAALVRVWGVSLQQISQATNLKNKNIKVFGGFGPGLPLANPNQYGLLLQGYIQQSYGNWIEEAQTLDLLVLAGSAPSTTTPTPKNLSLNWPAGQAMSDAIKNALTTAFPNYTINININPNLKFSGDLPGYYQNLTQFAQYVKTVSKSIINDPNYQGVSITLQGTTFSVFDGTQNSSSSGTSSGSTSSTSSVKQVAFTDLIGQPTWINAPLIQFKCNMRADFKVGDTVKLPQTQVTNTAAAMSSQVNQNVSFQGNFQIQSMRHIGNSRQPDSSAWVSVFEAFPLQQSGASS